MKKNGMNSSAPIVVVGSANMDLVVKARVFPRPGETVFGETFGMFPGGKGANQAVCAAKLGGNVRFIGRVGPDILGEKLLQNMKRERVDLRHTKTDPRRSTGIGLICIDGRGQNQISVVSGANMAVSPGDMRRCAGSFRTARVVLSQLEVPIVTVQRAMEQARRWGALTILNPAPARRLPVKLLRLVDVLTPNESELETLTGMRLTGRGAIVNAARRLLKRGVGRVIVTLGSKGCLLVDPDREFSCPALRVNAADTTAAGDAFSGALAYSLAGGRDVESAITFAVTVASLSVTKDGAQPSMPTMSQVRRFARKNGR